MIDIERLRKDLRDESAGAFFAGGFGGAAVEAAEIDCASPEKLIKMAEKKGFNLSDYEVI